MTREQIRGWPRQGQTNPFPVPHPSWRAESARGENAEKLSAREFWARLGL